MTAEKDDFEEDRSAEEMDEIWEKIDDENLRKKDTNEENVK
jgi:hypothetical protein